MCYTKNKDQIEADGRNIRLNPDEQMKVQNLYKLGTRAYDAQSYTECVAYLEDAIRIDPDNAEVNELIEKGYYYMAWDCLNKAEESERASQKEKQSAQLLSVSNAVSKEKDPTTQGKVDERNRNAALHAQNAAEYKRKAESYFNKGHYCMDCHGKKTCKMCNATGRCYKCKGKGTGLIFKCDVCEGSGGCYYCQSTTWCPACRGTGRTITRESGKLPPPPD